MWQQTLGVQQGDMKTQGYILDNNILHGGKQSFSNKKIKIKL